MIRNFHTPDLDPVLNIWLLASTQAHHFIPSTFWHEQLDAMRDIYLPSATTRVFEADGAVAGFCSVYGDTLAALFVEPARQGGGIGRQLLADAMLARSTLQLTVYSANAPAIRFYEAQGFVVLGEQLDEHTGHLEKVMRWVAEVSDDDQLQFLTGIAQRISRQEDVMAQVNNHSVDQVMHGFFPKRVLDTVLDAMTDHEKLSLDVLDNETKSRAFALVILKMLKTAAALENGGVRDA